MIDPGQGMTEEAWPWMARVKVQAAGIGALYPVCKLNCALCAVCGDAEALVIYKRDEFSRV
jgi:hypothetical protein